MGMRPGLLWLGAFVVLLATAIALMLVFVHRHGAAATKVYPLAARCPDENPLCDVPGGKAYLVEFLSLYEDEHDIVAEADVPAASETEDYTLQFRVRPGKQVVVNTTYIITTLAAEHASSGYNQEHVTFTGVTRLTTASPTVLWSYGTFPVMLVLANTSDAPVRFRMLDGAEHVVTPGSAILDVMPGYGEVFGVIDTDGTPDRLAIPVEAETLDGTHKSIRRVLAGLGEGFFIDTVAYGTDPDYAVNMILGPDSLALTLPQQVGDTFTMEVIDEVDLGSITFGEVYDSIITGAVTVTAAAPDSATVSLPPAFFDASSRAWNTEEYATTTPPP